MQGGNTAKIQT